MILIMLQDELLEQVSCCPLQASYRTEQDALWGRPDDNVERSSLYILASYSYLHIRKQTV